MSLLNIDINKDQRCVTAFSYCTKTKPKYIRALPSCAGNLYSNLEPDPPIDTFLLDLPSRVTLESLQPILRLLAEMTYWTTTKTFLYLLVI